MARIDLPEKGWVPSPVWEVYTSAENRFGYIPNTLKATSHSIRSLRAIDHFLQAYEEQGTLEAAYRILASLAAAHENKNRYGIEQVRLQARRFFIPEAKIEAVLDESGEAAAPGSTLTDAERAVIAYARAMTLHADAGEEALARIRTYLSEEKVVELSFIVAGRNFLDRLQCTFDVEAEPELAAKLN